MPNITHLEAGTNATYGTQFSDAFTATGGSSTDFARTGLRSLKMLAGFAWKKGICADAGRRISFWVHFDDANGMPNADCQMLILVNAAGSGVFSVSLQQSTAKLQILRSDNAVFATGSATFTTGVWYHISVAYTITSLTVNEFRVFVGSSGTPDATASNQTLSATSTDGLFLNTSSVSNAYVYFSDLYVDDGTTLDNPGEISVAAKRPNANGTTNNFTTQIGAGGSGYGTGHSPQVNERPLSQTNGWSMVGAGSAVTEEYTIENAATGDVDLTGATIIDSMAWVFASSLASETASIIAAGGTANIALTSTPTLFTKAVGSSTYPSGGNAVGVITATDLTTVSLYEAGMLVAYTPAPPAVVAADSFPQSILVSRMREW